MIHEFPNTGEPTAREFHCTAETPWKGQRAAFVRHADAYEVGEQRDGYPGGDYVDMRRPHCGTEWEAELPQ